MNWDKLKIVLWLLLVLLACYTPSLMRCALH
jgi:hypothetical protein